MFALEAEVAAANSSRHRLAEIFEAPKELIVAGRSVEKSLPFARDFLLGILAAEIGACHKEWEKMQSKIAKVEAL